MDRKVQPWIRPCLRDLNQRRNSDHQTYPHNHRPLACPAAKPVVRSQTRRLCLGVQVETRVAHRMTGRWDSAYSFRTDGSQSEGFPVRIRSASRRCFVYRPVATNFVPSSIIIERTSSPLLSITVISLRSTMRFPADGPLAADIQLETNSSIHSFVNRPWRIHLCSEALSLTVILNIRLSPEHPVRDLPQAEGS
jgi:hypothetical protein